MIFFALHEREREPIVEDTTLYLTWSLRLALSASLQVIHGPKLIYAKI